MYRVRQKDPLDVFLQDVRSRVSENPDLVAKLRAYAVAKRPLSDGQPIQDLEYIGSGPVHTHYRLGKVGKLWIATRESKEKLSPSIKRLEAEEYILTAKKRIAEHKPVPRAIGGVHSSNPELYFLLVEDLTSGGENIFYDHNTETCTVTRPNGQTKVVHFDFHLDPQEAYMKNDMVEFKHTIDDKILRI